MKAFLFDLNGTMINDMDYHARAWSRLVNEDLGGNFSAADVRREMYGKNPEVMVRLFGKDKFNLDEMNRLSMLKENYYQAEYLPDLKLIDGLDEFLAAAYKAGIPMAIGSAAIPYNIDFVLDNLNIRHYFDAVVSADDVELSKPHPETFLKAAEKLRVSIADCIVFEDVPKGVEAAANAGMVSVVLTTTHTEDEFEGLTNILHFAHDYTGSYFIKLTQS